MAKRKTPKMDKVVDLKPKAEKITDKQLERLQTTVSAVNRAKMDLGGLEIQKNSVMRVINEMQLILAELQQEFDKDYGTHEINIQDGSIMYSAEKEKENVEVNS